MRLNDTLSPNKMKGVVKTTKSTFGPSARPSASKNNDISVRSRSISNHSGRVRSRSVHDYADRNSSGAHKANCTAAQEIFQPFDVNHTSTSALGYNSRRSSNVPNSTRVQDKSSKKKLVNSSAIIEEEKKPQKKKIPVTTRNTSVTPKVSN